MCEISIIVPVYDVEKYLKKCVDSILNQTFKDFELILVDDGSPDNSGAICDQYAEKDSRVRVIHKENGGLSDARNAGIEVARGKYLGFVDSDDFVNEDMYKQLYTSIIENNADLSICGIFDLYEGKTPIKKTEKNYY
jgi:glycosyltransferase involved in cell wall biosynthesis